MKAQGDGGAAALQRAAKAATPELQRFLARYLAVAFAPSAAVDADELGRFFDAPLRGRVSDDLSALSLGPGGEHVSAVTMRPVTADAVLLARNGQSLAATLRFDVDGSAVTDEGTTPISLRSVFQLIRGGSGWTIVAYDSETKVPA